jgi:regulatory protein
LKCVPHEYKRDVFVIILNDEPWKEIHSSIFGKSPNLKFNEDNPELIKKQFQLLEQKLTRNFLLRRLTQRNYSSYELIQILDERLVAKESTSYVIQELLTAGYINDVDWIESFIRINIAKKNGPKNILMKLRMKGVPEEIGEKFLDRVEDAVPQSERIKILLETKYKKKDLSNFKEKQKVIASLLRKGFDYEEVAKFF